MKADRLLKLADFIEKVPVRNFNLDTVVGYSKRNVLTNVSEHTGTGEELKQLVKTGFGFKCDSAACAIGWTPAVFPRLVKWDGDAVYLDGVHMPYWSIGMKLFDISMEEADYLFDPSFYPIDKQGPKSVAKRIRAFVARKKAGKPGVPKPDSFYVSDDGWF